MLGQEIQIGYGVNQVDLNRDGQPDLVIRTRWDNGNAHSFDRYLVALVQPDLLADQRMTYEVPLGKLANYRIQTDEGAECQRKAYLFQFNKHQKFELIELKLAPGKTIYCEPTVLTTTTFQLTESACDAGLPPFFLQLVKAVKSRQIYHDVREISP